jgi:hypothetical protein
MVMHSNKIHRHLMWLGGCLLLAACSSKPQVHLFGRHLTTEETAKVVDWLKQQEFEVSVNQHKFPTSITRDSVVYPFNRQDKKYAEQLAAGYSNQTGKYLEFRPLNNGNHTFTSEHIGLYLFGSKTPQTQEASQLSLLQEFVAVKCDKASYAYLTLSSEQQFSAELGIDGQEVSNKLNGKWIQDNSMLQLQLSAGDSLRFSILPIDEMTPHGRRQGWLLKPVGPATVLDNCQFEFTVVL